MKNLGKLLLITACMMLASCVTNGRFNRLNADYTQLRTDYQESQLQLARCNTSVVSLEDRLTEARKNNEVLRADLANM